MITVLCSGQSNALGYGLYGLPISYVDSRVKVWNNVNVLGANGTAFITPAIQTAPLRTDGKYNNFAIWFCHRLAREMQDDVRLTLVCKGNSSITYWVTSDDGLAVAADEIDDVCNASGQGAADIFLWHQGENDAAMSYANYNTYFHELRTRLINSGRITSSTPIVVGGLASNYTSFNTNVLQPLAANYSYIYYADSSGLADIGDGAHFTGQALCELGYDRYWNAVKDALTPPSISDGVHSRGSNVRGDWIKYNDGRLECSGIFDLTFADPNYLLGTWVYPEPFISTPTIIPWTQSGINNQTFSVKTPLCPYGESTRTSASFLLGIDRAHIPSPPNPATYPFVAGNTSLTGAVAYGRWK